MNKPPEMLSATCVGSVIVPGRIALTLRVKPGSRLRAKLGQSAGITRPKTVLVGIQDRIFARAAA